MSYTLPQIVELIKHTNKHIEFQVEITTAPLRAIFGGEEEERMATEDDIMALAQILGG